MRSILKYILPVLTLVIGLEQTRAQQSSSYGTHFWVSFMDNYTESTAKLSLTINARTLAFVTISFPTGDSTYIANPAIPTVINIPWTMQAVNPFVKEKKALRITATDSITVFATNSAFRTTDATLVLPDAALSTEYIVTTYNSLNATSSEAVIVATQDNTTIDFVPSINMGSYVQGQQYTINLNKGQTFLFKAAGGDLTGTWIKSRDLCKPIAVFGGSECTYILAPFCDHLYEQMIPVRNWGKTYYTVPLLTRKKGDTYRLMASEDSTRVRINNGTPVVLNVGKHYETLLATPSIIKADKPISVVQFSNGGDFDNNVNADPFMLQLMPMEQAIDRTTFNTTDAESEMPVKHFVNLVAKTSDVATILLDTNRLADDFKKYPQDTNYSYAQIPLEFFTDILTSHVIVSAGGKFNAYAYGYAFHYSYGYGIGGSMFNLQFTFDWEKPVCRGREIKFTPQIPKRIQVGSYFWDFGDGTSSTQVSPTHAYTTAGTYSVKLRIKMGNDTCSIDSVIQTLTVEDKGDLKAEAGTNGTICKGDSIRLNASGGGTYSWEPAIYVSNPSVANPWAKPWKTELFTVTVRDNYCGGSNSDTVRITVKTKPRAGATYNISQRTIDAQAIPRDEIDTWKWDMGDGTAPKITQNVSHTYGIDGAYTIKLMVKNSCGWDTIVFTVNVKGSGGGGGGDDGKDTVNWDPTGLEKEKINREGFLVYPNPTGRILWVEFDPSAGSPHSFYLQGLRGDRLTDLEMYSLSSGMLSLDLGHVPSGNYILVGSTAGNKRISIPILRE